MNPLFMREFPRKNQRKILEITSSNTFNRKIFEILRKFERQFSRKARDSFSLGNFLDFFSIKRFPHVAQGFFQTDLEGGIHSRFNLPCTGPEFLKNISGEAREKKAETPCCMKNEHKPRETNESRHGFRVPLYIRSALLHHV